MAQRPKDTYVSQVFNFGVDKNLPFGFVNVVYNKNGSMAGYLFKGKFYEPGEKLPKPASKESARKQYTGSIEERIVQAEKQLNENKKAAEFANAQNRDKMSQKEATARGDIYDNYATSLKPQIEEYEFKLDNYARKIALGDKLSVVEENEIKYISKKYASLQKAYNEARTDAVDLYYGKKQTAETPTGKKIATGKIKTTSDTTIPSVKLTELKLPSDKAASTSISSVPQTQVKPTGTKTSTASTPATAKQAKPFEQPMTIAGQVQTDASVVNADKEAEALNAAAALDLAGTLFEHVPSLKNLLDQYVNKGWTNSRFLQELRNDTWYKKNSAEIKARYTQLYNYQDLVASGQADGTTDYEKQINTLKDQITKKAREMGSGLASDPAAIQRAAENMYITNTGIDDALTTNILASAIRPIGGTIGGKPTEGYSGKALQDYQTIQAAAKANGFKVSDIIPGGQNELQVLQGIATGAIDVNRIAQDARKLAAQGQPQYVRDLLGQGYNLDQVYAPYRQTMANILEINDPNQIDLNDPTLRTAITDKGDMNLYDFKKALRQDNRWQYTEQAKSDVSNAALNVLRDFGFQG